jgi:lipoprotein-releasing system ATP-binding protein
MPPIIETRKLCKSYDTEVRLHVLKNIDMTINQGEFVCIAGPSGSGKSTLMHIIGLLDRPTKGSVLYRGGTVSGKNDTDLAYLRNHHMGFVFQDHLLLPEFDALHNVMMPMLIRRHRQRTEIKERAGYLLNMVGLSDRTTHIPSKLSGGQRQRVAIARALVNNPEVVLADEPTGNLDQKTSHTIWEMMLTLNKEQNVTFIIVTHDMSLTKSSSRVIEIVDGVIVSDARKRG